MKLYCIILALFLISCNSNSRNTESSKSTQKKIKYDLSKDQIIDLITFDLNNDSISDTIYFLNQPKNDPGRFTKLFVSVTNKDTLSLTNIEAWDTVNFNSANHTNSNLIYINKNANSTHLILCGFQYSCCPKKLTIIGITKNKINPIYHKDFDVSDIVDINKDGNIEIIGRNSFVSFYDFDKKSNSEIGTYVPIEVYSLFPNKLLISYELTKKYNQDNYVFAGFEYSETIKVGYPKKREQAFLINNSDSYRCNFDFLKLVADNFNTLNYKQVHDFLLTFDEKCKNNVEFSEWSSELLINTLNKYPDLVIQSIQTDSNINAALIYNNIESPIIDINFNEIYINLNKIEDSDVKNKILKRLKIAETPNNKIVQKQIEIEKPINFQEQTLDSEFENATLYSLTDTIEADFNGDGNIDKAIFIKKGGTSGIIFKHGFTNTETKIGFGQPFSHLTEFNWVDFWGLVNDSTSYEIIFNETDIIGDTIVRLENPSIVVQKEEVGGGLITFQKGKYKWIHQSD
ncbi:MAG: hypothetical protein JEZ01_18025 [Labilibaculum sp.]|nr:hypothetical protein [Labilibaculum sp.]MBI9059667.1 hypothetical protein [Labilibaculum sp.]